MIRNEEYIDESPKLFISKINFAAMWKTLMRGWAKNLEVFFEIDWTYFANVYVCLPNWPYIICPHNATKVNSFTAEFPVLLESRRICRKFHWQPTMAFMNNRTLGIYSHYHLNLSCFLHFVKTRETGCHNGPARLHISILTTSEVCGMSLQTVTDTNTHTLQTNVCVSRLERNTSACKQFNTIWDEMTFKTLALIPFKALSKINRIGLKRDKLLIYLTE